MPGVRAARYWGIAGLATWLLAASCTGGGSDHLSGGIPADRGPGFVNEAWLTRRQDDFLRFITTSREPPSALNLISRFERSDRDKAFKFDAATVRVGDFADSFKRLDTFADTGDFDLLYLINLWYADRDHLPKDVRAAIEKRILAFKFGTPSPHPRGSSTRSGTGRRTTGPSSTPSNCWPARPSPKRRSPTTAAPALSTPPTPNGSWRTGSPRRPASVSASGTPTSTTRRT